LKSRSERPGSSAPRAMWRTMWSRSGLTAYGWSMIFSENRYPLFGIML
jgi:hypothetical protein